jgi:hypothetical protein
LRSVGANSSQEPHLQNNQSKIDWRCGSSGRVVQNPEFKPSSHPKNKKALFYRFNFAIKYLSNKVSATKFRNVTYIQILK